MSDAELSDAEQKQVVALLAKLSPGFLPYDIFVQIARLAVLPIIEFVPLRLNKNGDTEVLLLERPETDPIWPGELHTPGTVIRPTDTEGEMYRAFERILEGELKGTKVSTPYYAGSNLHKSKRGMEQAQIFWVEVLGEPKAGKFYPADNLPDNFMQSQADFVRLAVTNFEQQKAS